MIARCTATGETASLNLCADETVELRDVFLLLSSARCFPIRTVNCLLLLIIIIVLRTTSQGYHFVTFDAAIMYV